MSKLPTSEDVAAIQEAARTIRPAVEALEDVTMPAVDPESVNAAARALKQARPALEEAQRILSGSHVRLFGTRIRDALDAFRR